MKVIQLLKNTDRAITRFMHRYGITFLRFSLAIIFIWFGALKPFDMSEAATLYKQTVGFSPVLHSFTSFTVLGIWEVIIGICFLYRPLIRVAILMLFLQMPGTFLPMITATDVCFNHFPFELTLQGQYILKNVTLIAAAIVIGGTLYKKEKK
jgi:uncharacterized membrane protein YkgB